jgi:hypothetical protein
MVHPCSTDEEIRNLYIILERNFYKIILWRNMKPDDTGSYFIAELLQVIINIITKVINNDITNLAEVHLVN